MARFRLLILSIILILFLSGCKVTSAVDGQDKSVRVCRNTTKLILDTFKDLKIPDHFRVEKPLKTSADFVLSTLIEELDFVEINEGFQVDYVYSYRNAIGQPLVYSLPIGKQNFSNEDDYRGSKHFPLTYGLESVDQVWGFLQLAILEELGGQFYQYFTAEYDDVRVICDVDDIEALIDQLGRDEHATPMNLWQQMRALTISDTDPSVTILTDKNLAKVSMLIFTNDRGILRRTYEYTTFFPHELVATTDVLIVEYHSKPPQTSKR